MSQLSRALAVFRQLELLVPKPKPRHLLNRELRAVATETWRRLALGADQDGFDDDLDRAQAAECAMWSQQEAARVDAKVAHHLAGLTPEGVDIEGCVRDEIEERACPTVDIHPALVGYVPAPPRPQVALTGGLHPFPANSAGDARPSPDSGAGC